MSLKRNDLCKIFYTDHPFIFIIQDRENGNILFPGKGANPGGET